MIYIKYYIKTIKICNKRKTIAYLFIMKKKIYASIFAICLVVLLSLIFVFLPLSSRQNIVEDRFLGEKSEYQGVITCYNVDTFEGGKASKASFLEKIAIEFEKNNRGLYILVKNITIDEFLLQIKNGNLPNICSFGEGVYDEIKQYLGRINFNIELKDIVKNSHIDLEFVKPWCFGFYTFISTNQVLSKSGHDGAADLKSVIDECAYEIKLKKSIKHVNSYVYAGGAKTEIKNYITRFSKNIENNDYSFFEAYDKFVNNKASILVGTHRDLVRMENRVANGKIIEYVFNYESEYTDLVQYLGYCPSGSSVIDLYSQKFIKFATSGDIQKKLGTIGMCSVLKNIVANNDNVIANIERKFK